MSQILEEMVKTSIILFNKYLNDYPDIKWEKWPKEKIIRKKRVPKDSRINKNDFAKMSAKEIYNFIRCLEDPYPNAYIEDDFGKLFFKKVRFESRK